MATKNEQPVKTKKPRKKLSVVFKQFWSDLKKITWPSGKTVLNNSIKVIVSMVVIAAILGVVDLGLTKLLELIIA
ncbi:MAG: preprotein translocase subunit SecE [Clostridia bacterium]|nr:preprotein translocase subunit SecE [Clostridia bacterium]